MLNPWLGVGLVLAVVSGLLRGLHALQERQKIHPELSRKLMHVATGLVALSFPWLFHSAWPVGVLAGVSIIVFVGLRHLTLLKEQLGGVIDGVARESWGEIYFPLAVALLFILARGDALLYGIPLLILTLADAVAAWIGVIYGQHRYRTDDGRKSAEGSVAFFLTAFLSTHIPLLLFTQTGRAESLLIGLTVGLLVMIMEAVAWRGLDNLFIPLGGFILLRTYLTMDVPTLTARLVVAVLLMGLMILLRRRTTLKQGALLGAALVGYACWALGGWQWLVAPLLLLGSYTLLSPRTRRNIPRVHGTDAVISVASASAIWLFLAQTWGRPEFLYPYTLAFAAHLSMIGIARLSYDYPTMKKLTLLTRP
jgi:phytol kinase